MHRLHPSPFPHVPGALAVLSLLALGSACDQSQPLAPTSGESHPRPSFRPANGPSHPGHSFVFRQDIDLPFLVSVDESQNLVVRHYNAEDIDFCGGSSPTPTAEEQLVLTRHHAVETFRTGELPVYVYRLSEVPPSEVSPQFCEDLVTKWIYRGTHRLRNHDNNLFGFPSPTNAFGWRGVGTVYDRAGQRHHYLESFFAVIDWGVEPPRVIRDDYRLVIK
jgi:hypothetical protein